MTHAPSCLQDRTGRGQSVGSYLAGQFAGAQAVLHGQRLGHVRNRLVDLLQVSLVFHLHAVVLDTRLPD